MKNTESTYLSRKEACQRYGISIRTLERHIKRRIIRFHRVGGKVKFHSVELEEDYGKAGNRIAYTPMKPVRINPQ